MSKECFALLLALLLCPFQGAFASVDCRAAPAVDIQVVRHRWHTGIVIPREQIAGELAFLLERFPRARYFEFGWGDREFYRKPDSTWLIVRSLFWPTASVLHVVGLEAPAAELPHGDLLSLTLSPSGIRELGEALAGDFRRKHGKPVIIEPGLYGESRFYEARGKFWFARTCNTWTARRLADAGVSLRTFMTLTADSVMEQLREAGEESPCPVTPGNGERP